ncbi:hypothetical protein [Haloferax volcanii]|uniref:Uncharacterized protein n=2 Tax=Haloferax volcanii TaxID=2246 RepID=M0HWK7_HALVO|nr:hypothetical protein [Haloferax alexandrinus]ELZ88108.1 hypothetical protein C452_15100 [Haloferax alexandrinus JCM 10717]NLV03825.1 hypothetical protein [Haloferax alexandrinus]
MAATKLIPYKVQIHPNGEASEDDLWDLTDLQQYDTTVQSQLGTSSEAPAVSDVESFTDLFRSFCQYYETNLADLGEEVERLSNVTLALSTDWESSDQVVEGNLYLGNYGVVRNLVDRQSGERRERGRDIDDAEEKPLYFMTYTPSGNAKEAYLLLERSRRYGAKEPFYITLRRWIREYYSDEVNVKIDPVRTEDIFPKMREADRTVRLRLEKDGSPDQLHSDFDSVFDQEEMKQAIEFRPEGGDDMSLVVDELEAWYNDSETAFETIDGVTYNNVKITIEKNNSDETISLTKGEAELRKNIDLSDIAEEGDIPVLSEISSRAHGFLTTVTGGRTGTSSLFR